MAEMDGDESLDELRKTAHEVVSGLDGVSAVVGWDGAHGTYWWLMQRFDVPESMREANVQIGDVHYEGGYPYDTVTNIADLVNRTWGEIDWPATGVGVLRKLQDDPVIEALAWSDAEETPFFDGVEDFLIEVLTASIVLPEDGSTSSGSPEGGTADDDSPKGRRGFLGRRSA